MFMFRMMIYLYERKHARGREPLVDTLSYFFLLPNYVFLHFPVVDYRTLQRGYFARGIHEIQRAGLAMMSRGTLHLLALSRDRPHAADLRRARCTARRAWRATSSAITCCISGSRGSSTWPAACCTSSASSSPRRTTATCWRPSFTDYWRRINIYWKDFMVRVVFNPVVFRLKRWPQPVALAAATAVVFVVTWLLHAYQSYWLRGIWGFGAPDALFWGILGVLVLINVQLDARRGRRRDRRPVRDAAAAGAPGAPHRRHVHDDRPALVALVEPERRGLGGPAPARIEGLSPRTAAPAGSSPPRRGRGGRGSRR